jgi:hypothetical protein
MALPSRRATQLNTLIHCVPGLCLSPAQTESPSLGLNRPGFTGEDCFELSADDLEYQALMLAPAADDSGIDV